MRTKSFIFGAIFMLFAGLVFVVGVFAASNASVNINGIVNFEAIGNVKATVAFEHTANNNIKVMKNESEVTNANGVLTIVGNESNMTGSFVSDTIDLEAPAGAKGDVTYTYTLTITNTYASDAVADKKDLQITFTPPTTTANISSHFQSNYDWTDNSLILAPGAKVKVRVTFTTDVNYSNNANLTSSLRLEAVQSEDRQNKPEEFAMTYNIVGATKTSGDNFAIQGDEKEITFKAENPDYTKWTITVDGQPVEPTIDWTQEKTTATFSLENISKDSVIEVKNEIDYWDGTSATAPYFYEAEGAGTTEDNPYLIRNGAQFNNIRNISSSGKYFKMLNNIYLNEGNVIDSNGDLIEGTYNEWSPLGMYGTFDGSNYYVSGVYLNNSNNYQGLFSCDYGLGTTKNLGLINSYIKGNYYVGGFVGSKNKWNYIENCFNKATVVGNGHVGGIVGHLYGVVKDCWNGGKVIGNSNVSGIAGVENTYGDGSVEISNCYNIGSVSGVTNVGGVCGFIHDVADTTNNPIIQNCYNFGTVILSSGTATSIGGVVGQNGQNSTNIGGTVQDCYYWSAFNSKGIGDTTYAGSVTMETTAVSTSNYATAMTTLNANAIANGWRQWQILPNGLPSFV